MCKQMWLIYKCLVTTLCYFGYYLRVCLLFGYFVACSAWKGADVCVFDVQRFLTRIFYNPAIVEPTCFDIQNFLIICLISAFTTIYYIVCSLIKTLHIWHCLILNLEMWIKSSTSRHSLDRFLVCMILSFAPIKLLWSIYF